MNESDGVLVEAARAGDQRAFEAIYYRHRDWVSAIAFRFCGNREDALDVLQEAFAYFFRKLPDFEFRTQLRTFLYPVVKHLALNKKRSCREIPEGAAGTPRVSQGTDIEDMLANLPETHREVVWMRFVDGLGLQEIAEVLEIPLGTVKSRLHNAIEALRSKGLG